MEYIITLGLLGFLSKIKKYFLIVTLAEPIQYRSKPKIQKRVGNFFKIMSYGGYY